MKTSARLSAVVIPAVAFLGLSAVVRARGSATPSQPSVLPAFGDPLPGLTPDELASFEAGKDEFNEEEAADEGLGPVFNAVSCAACHFAPAPGGGSPQLETRFGTVVNGQFDPLTQLGGSLIQSQGIGVAGQCEFTGEVVPGTATIQTGRRTTPLFGLGLVDAVPDDVLRGIARHQTFDKDGVSGRVNIVLNIKEGKPAVGKFGWKAQVPTLFQFSGDAYLNEMGITSPQFMQENCPQGDCSLLVCDPAPEPEDAGPGVDAFAAFMTLLAPPSRGLITQGVNGGELIFQQIGCATCHLPELHTGPSPVSALNRVAFRPFSDFLLHDVGRLGDGISQGVATGRELRTAPLWGLRAQSTLLHDGRALSIRDAILAHDGEAVRARNRYIVLDALRKQKLLAFLGSL